MNLRALRGRGGLVLLVVAAYVPVACALLAALVWADAPPAQREPLRAAVSNQAATLIIGGVAALAGLVALLANTLGRFPAAARRLAADTRLLLRANPDHRLDESGPEELRKLAAAVNELAERRRVAERDVEREVNAARADLEQERNRLAALMADLTVAVLVCNAAGRILLYNAAARSLLADDAALGLGRSVFGIVDRGLVAHALERVEAGSAESQVASVLRGRQMLQVRLAPVRDPDGEVTGFLLVLEDQTARLQASRAQDALLRDLTEGTRASLGSIRAAVETVLDYPDMEAEERRQFVEVVRDESHRLGDRVERWAAQAAAHLGENWLLADMRDEDLLTVLARDIERDDGVTTSMREGTGDLWVRVDSHAIALTAVHLASRLRDECSVRLLTLSLTRAGHHAQLAASWTGRAPDADVFSSWLHEPLPGGAAANVQEVVDRHDGELWSGEGPDGTAYVQLLLPLADAAPDAVAQSVTPADLGLGAHPGHYDFALFDLPEQSLAWQDRELGDIAYTVFDTETTGFYPDQGDEIISVGAVRVVNARLLRQETFERLVDPGRSVPAASVAVHGITTDMLRGEPAIESVLPQFARFAEDTVLVGHNVGFDMSFLRRKESQTGVRFTQPVLDTLLLDAAIHPDHERHSLEAIAARVGVDVKDRHTALGDALLTGEVFVRFLGLLQHRGIRTLGGALEASRATYQARLDATLYGRSR